LVEGNAASAIDGFALTADNYESAVKLLKDRFADPQIIISSHMEELLNLPAVSDIHKVSKIRQLYDSIEPTLEVLEIWE
jgi:anion-transporting  ArsA/GET3 family ATPase